MKRRLADPEEISDGAFCACCLVLLCLALAAACSIN